MPFSVINDLNSGKDITHPEKFDPWLTNVCYSIYPDTIYHAQMMNLNYDLEPEIQLTYFINTIRSCKRWQKWPKKIRSEYYDLVKEWFGFSDKKTKEALAVLTKDQLEEIKNKNKKE